MLSSLFPYHLSCITFTFTLQNDRHLPLPLSLHPWYFDWSLSLFHVFTEQLFRLANKPSRFGHHKHPHHLQLILSDSKRRHQRHMSYEPSSPLLLLSQYVVTGCVDKVFKLKTLSGCWPNCQNPEKIDAHHTLSPHFILWLAKLVTQVTYPDVDWHLPPPPYSTSPPSPPPIFFRLLFLY